MQQYKQANRHFIAVIQSKHFKIKSALNISNCHDSDMNISVFLIINVTPNMTLLLHFKCFRWLYGLFAKDYIRHCKHFVYWIGGLSSVFFLLFGTPTIQENQIQLSQWIHVFILVSKYLFCGRLKSRKWHELIFIQNFATKTFTIKLHTKHTHTNKQEL